MRVPFSCVLCVTVCVSVLSDNKFLLDAYHWRDYMGQIPPDALPGGSRNGITTYIGQVLHRELLIPAEINPRTKTVIYEWSYLPYQAPVYTRVKILCTPHPNRFKWIRTGSKTDRTVANFVVGGYEENARILVGRKRFNSEMVVGKVVIGRRQNTLYAIINGTVTQHREFGVLAYGAQEEGDEEVKIELRNREDSKCERRKVTINVFN